MPKVLAILILLVVSASGPTFSEVSSAAAYHLVLARLLADEDQMGEAAESFVQAIELAPADPYLRLEYSKFLARQRRFMKAANQATAARQLAPRDPHVLRLYAESQMKLVGHDPEALDSAREALEELRSIGGWDVESMVTLGQIYLSESRPSRAAEVFQEILDRISGNRMVYRLLVDALMRAGEAGRAEEVLRRAIELDPLFTRARVVLAEMLGEQNRHTEAVAVLRAAPDAAADDLDLQKRLSFELQRTGDFDGALQVIERVLQAEPDYYAGIYLKTVILSVKGENRAASDLASRLVALHPENLEVALLLSRLLERQGRSAEAIEHLRRIEKLLRQSGDRDTAARARSQLAGALVRAERWAEVAGLLEPHLPELEDAGEIDLILLCSEALARTSEQGKAMALLSRFDRSSPAGRAALAKKAEILFALDQDVEGRERIADLVASDEFEDLLRAAGVYQRLERYNDAIPILEQAYGLEPRSTEAMFWLAASYERTGRDSDAEAILEDLLAIDPEFAPALNYLGYMWAEQGENLDRAIRLVQQAVALEPDNGAYVDSLGWAHFQLGQYEEARDLLERAASLVGEDAVVFEHLGDLYRVLGRLDEARKHYEKAIALGDENAGQVQQKLDQLSDEP